MKVLVAHTAKAVAVKDFPFRRSLSLHSRFYDVNLTSQIVENNTTNIIDATSEIRPTFKWSYLDGTIFKRNVEDVYEKKS